MGVNGMSTALDTVVADIRSAQPAFLAISNDPAAFEAEAGFATQILSANEYALGVAQRNRQSVVNAVTNVAAIGLSLNPALKQAYLVPRDNKICLDISYIGLMHLAQQDGAIRWAQCAVVREKDEFTLVGVDQMPVHKFNPFSADRGEIIGVYVVVKTQDGDYLTHTMPITDVYAIRERSSAWKAWIAKKVRCPWVTDEQEMIRKTCVKQASKYWPKPERSTGRMEKAIEYLNTETGEGLEPEPAPPNYSIPALTGAMEAMSRERQNVLRELAEEVLTIWKFDGDAPALDKLLAAELDDDDTKAIWTLLPSDMRAALKREKAGRREAVETIAKP